MSIITVFAKFVNIFSPKSKDNCQSEPGNHPEKRQAWKLLIQKQAQEGNWATSGPISLLCLLLGSPSPAHACWPALLLVRVGHEVVKQLAGLGAGDAVPRAEGAIRVA